MCIPSAKCSEAEQKVEGGSTGRALPKRLLNGVKGGTQSSEKQLRPSPVSLILFTYTPEETTSTLSAHRNTVTTTLYTQQDREEAVKLGAAWEVHWHTSAQ